MAKSKKPKRGDKKSQANKPKKTKNAVPPPPEAAPVAAPDPAADVAQAPAAEPTTEPVAPVAPGATTNDADAGGDAPTDTTSPFFSRRVVIAIAAVLFVTLLVILYSLQAPRGAGLVAELERVNGSQPSTTTTAAPTTSSARLILTNYEEVRTNAKYWALTYWGMTFLAALLSAIAGLILKLDRLRNHRSTNDVAATLAVVSALLITIITTGDFRMKWQANRLAAAELEALGYRLLREPDRHREVLQAVENAMYRRQVAIIGNMQLAETTPSTADGVHTVGELPSNN